MKTKTPGELAYEHRLGYRPFYHDGSRRPDWSGLDADEQVTWGRGAPPQHPKKPWYRRILKWLARTASRPETEEEFFRRQW